MEKEINKLEKRIRVAKQTNDHKELIELHNIVGGLYSDIGSYYEAIHHHKEALDACKTLGNQQATAVTLRYVGEATAAIGSFYQAIDYIKKYLDLAKRLEDKVEIQRAWTTLGRVYLMKAQDMKENSDIVDDGIKSTANEALKKFQTALDLAESVRSHVDEKEFAQMRSGLFVNIGLLEDLLGRFEQCQRRFLRAIEICKSAKIRDDLYRCQVLLTSLLRQRNCLELAAKISDDALTTAQNIGKKLLICDAYIEKGLVLLNQRQFAKAKRTFALAYLEKSPNEEDRNKAQRLLKIAHLIVVAFDELSKESVPKELEMRLCDRLGDLFVSVPVFKLAIEFYKRAFTNSRLCARPKAEIAKLLYSIGETYADDGQFENALKVFQKELEFRDGNSREQCASLIKIAHMLEYLNRAQNEVAEHYERALEKADQNAKLKYQVLKEYLGYLRKRFCMREEDEFNEDKLRELDTIFNRLKLNKTLMEELELELELEESAVALDDEIANVDDIISDDEDNDEVLMVGRRRRHKSAKFKPNEVGDTPLHEACIQGDLKRVKSLIAQGHEINPTDFAGWIPLHEACNHGHYEIAEYLIENGADVNNRGVKGVSPLHDAATNGHFDIVHLLIKSGANVIALTDAGETVLSCMRDYKHRNFATMSNREMTEFRHLEQELLNIMDRRGFNLMEQRVSGGAKSSSDGSLSNNARGGGAASAGSGSTERHCKASQSAAAAATSSSSGVASGGSPPPRAREFLRPSRVDSKPPVIVLLDEEEEEDLSHERHDDKRLVRLPGRVKVEPKGEGVREYRSAMSSLKRRRQEFEDEDQDQDGFGRPRAEGGVKREQPPVYQTEEDPSMETKRWIIDDVEGPR